MSTEKTEIAHLYTGCYQKMFTMARQMLKDEKEAEDVVSDVFARLADGSITLPSDRPQSYLIVATRNNCLDHIRRLTLRDSGHDRVRRNRDMANLPTGGNGCWIIKVKYYGAHLFIRNNLV